MSSTNKNIKFVRFSGTTEKWQARLNASAYVNSVVFANIIDKVADTSTYIIYAGKDATGREYVYNFSADTSVDLTNIIKHLNVLDISVNNIYDILDKIDSSINIINNSISILNSSVNNIESNVTILNSSISNLDVKVSNIDSSVTNLYNKIITLDGSIHNSISILNSSVNNIESTISILNSSVSNLDVKVSNIDSSVTNIYDILNQGLVLDVKGESKVKFISLLPQEASTGHVTLSIDASIMDSTSKGGTSLVTEAYVLEQISKIQPGGSGTVKYYSTYADAVVGLADTSVGTTIIVQNNALVGSTEKYLDNAKGTYIVSELNNTKYLARVDNKYTYTSHAGQDVTTTTVGGIKAGTVLSDLIAETNGDFSVILDKMLFPPKIGSASIEVKIDKNEADPHNSLVLTLSVSKDVLAAGIYYSTNSSAGTWCVVDGHVNGNPPAGVDPEDWTPLAQKIASLEDISIGKYNSDYPGTNVKVYKHGSGASSLTETNVIEYIELSPDASIPTSSGYDYKVIINSFNNIALTENTVIYAIGYGSNGGGCQKDMKSCATKVYEDSAAEPINNTLSPYNINLNNGNVTINCSTKVTLNDDYLTKLYSGICWSTSPISNENAANCSDGTKEYIDVTGQRIYYKLNNIIYPSAKVQDGTILYGDLVDAIVKNNTKYYFKGYVVDTATSSDTKLWGDILATFNIASKSMPLITLVNNGIIYDDADPNYKKARISMSIDTTDASVHLDKFISVIADGQNLTSNANSSLNDIKPTCGGVNVYQTNLYVTPDKTINTSASLKTMAEVDNENTSTAQIKATNYSKISSLIEFGKEVLIEEGEHAGKYRVDISTNVKAATVSQFTKFTKFSLYVNNVECSSVGVQTHDASILNLTYTVYAASNTTLNVSTYAEQDVDAVYGVVNEYSKVSASTSKVIGTIVNPTVTFATAADGDKIYANNITYNPGSYSEIKSKKLTFTNGKGHDGSINDFNSSILVCHAKYSEVNNHYEFDTYTITVYGSTGDTIDSGVQCSAVKPRTPIYTEIGVNKKSAINNNKTVTVTVKLSEGTYTPTDLNIYDGSTLVGTINNPIVDTEYSCTLLGEYTVQDEHTFKIKVKESGYAHDNERGEYQIGNVTAPKNIKVPVITCTLPGTSNTSILKDTNSAVIIYNVSLGSGNPLNVSINVDGTDVVTKSYIANANSETYTLNNCALDTEYKISIYGYDGISSATTVERKVKFAPDAPRLNVIYPNDGLDISTNTITCKYIAEKGNNNDVSLYVKLNSVQVLVQKVNNFSVEQSCIISNLVEGTNSLEFKLIDGYGRESSTITRNITYTAPAAEDVWYASMFAWENAIFQDYGNDVDAFFGEDYDEDLMMEALDLFQTDNITENMYSKNKNYRWYEVELGRSANRAVFITLTEKNEETELYISNTLHTEPITTDPHNLIQTNRSINYDSKTLYISYLDWPAGTNSGAKEWFKFKNI